MKVQLGRFAVQLPFPDGWDANGSLLLENSRVGGVAANIRVTWQTSPRKITKDPFGGGGGVSPALEALIAALRLKLEAEVGKPVKLVKSEPKSLGAGEAALADFEIALSPKATGKHLVLIATLDRSVITVGCTWAGEPPDSPFVRELLELLGSARFEPGGG